MFRLLKLSYLREINLSSEEIGALLRRLETDRGRPEDDEVLMRVGRAHTQLSADDLDAFQCLEGPSLAHRLSPQETGSKKGAPPPSARIGPRDWGEGWERIVAG